MSHKKRPIGMAVPRLNRKKAWGFWHVTLDGTTLVYDRAESGNYQVQLTDLATLDDAIVRVREVIAIKSAWVDQRVVDDLRRALRDLKGLSVPWLDVDERQRSPFDSDDI